MQGYALTETCGAGTLSSHEDLTTGHCGPPLPCVEIMLRDWDEGGYHTSDTPRSRGEILLGGGNITQGYFHQPQKTKEDFFVDNMGQRWFCSGDIGTFDEDGNLHVIDRKKDLVKLQAGEYLSLAKVETALSHSIYVESICAYGDGLRNFLVAIVVPKRKPLGQLAKKMGIKTPSSEAESWSAVCENAQLRAVLLKDLHAVAIKFGLERFEIPQRLHLSPEPWTPDTGLVTDAFKLKRKPVQERYQFAIDAMYAAED